MNRPLAATTLLALLAPAVDAQNDRIVWTDGSATKDCRVLDFTVQTIKYRAGGSTEERSADLVADLTVEKVDEAFARARNSTDRDAKYDRYLNEANSLAEREPFLAQFGYIEAARLLRENSQWSEAFQLLEQKLAGQIPNSGFLPELYRFKLDYYLPQGSERARDAAAVAKSYSDAALQKGWPDGFVHEAQFYSVKAQALDGTLSGGALQGELSSLLNKTEGDYPAVADRVRVELANVRREAGKIDQAKEAYQQVVDRSGVDPSTLAAALMGLGHCYMAEGDPANTEPFRSALLAFLRVYLETERATARHPEALYLAAQAAEKWRGEESAAMARRLRGYLRRDFPDSEWAQR